MLSLQIYSLPSHSPPSEKVAQSFCTNSPGKLRSPSGLVILLCPAIPLSGASPKMLQSTLIRSPAARIDSIFSPFSRRCFSLHNTTPSWVSPCLCLTLAKAPHLPCSFHRGCRDDHGCLLVSFVLFHYYNVGEGKGQKVIQWHLRNVDLRMLPDETAV